jgi:hypothetical protein
MSAAVTPPLSPWSDDHLDVAPITTEVSATLPVGAHTAYAAFADVAHTPRWLSIVQSAHVVGTDELDRPLRVAFLARLERGAIGYTLHYRWDPTDLSCAWSTPEDGSVRIAGDARFAPLSARACLMHYRISVELPFAGEWATPGFGGHAAAAVASEFREYLRRA